MPTLPSFRKCLYVLGSNAEELRRRTNWVSDSSASGGRQTFFFIVQAIFRASSVRAIPYFMLQSVEKQNSLFPLLRRTPDPSIPETQLLTRSHSKHRRFKNLASKSKRIGLADIPDEVISKILDCYTLITNSSPSHIRLLNKRLAVLALPFSFRTISLSSPSTLSGLILSPESPLYNPYLGTHVQCLELCYIPRTFELLEVDNTLANSLPNLVTIRFKFSMGVLMNSGLAIQPSISQDVLLTSIRFCSNAFLRRFLSQLRPRRFEWVSPEAERFYLVGVSPMLRSLLHSWESLSYIYLEGICLIEQPNLASWHVSLLANRVHIKAPFSKAGPTFLAGLQQLRDSNICALLLLEESSPENVFSGRSAYQGDVPVLTYGNTMVSLKHWSTANRRKLKSRVARRSSHSTGTHRRIPRGQPFSKRSPPLLVTVLFLVLFFLVGLCMIRFTLTKWSKGTYTFGQSGLLWMICHDGSFLAEVICTSETSLWFPDRSLMLHPT